MHSAPVLLDPHTGILMMQNRLPDHPTGDSDKGRVSCKGNAAFQVRINRIDQHEALQTVHLQPLWYGADPQPTVASLSVASVTVLVSTIVPSWP